MKQSKLSIALAGLVAFATLGAVGEAGAMNYHVQDDRVVLSGGVTFADVVALPALRALAGHADPVPPEVTLTLAEPYPHPSRCTRILRGALDLTDGTARLRLTGDQRNAVISSAIGCDALAVVPAGTGPLAAGTVLKGFLV